MNLMHRSITMQATNEREPMVINTRADYSATGATVYVDLLADRDKLQFAKHGVENSATHVVNDARTLRIPLFHDQQRGGGHLVGINAAPTYVDRSKGNLGYCTRPEASYLVQREGGEITGYGVWAFYLNLTKEQVEAINNSVRKDPETGAITKDGRVKVQYSVADEDWLPTEWEATEITVLAMKNIVQETAEPQQEEAVAA